MCAFTFTPLLSVLFTVILIGILSNILKLDTFISVLEILMFSIIMIVFKKRINIQNITKIY